jgi:hypothetical protein
MAMLPWPRIGAPASAEPAMTRLTCQSMPSRLLMAFAILLVCSRLAALAASPEEMLSEYARQAREADPAFSGFSGERGRALYFVEFEMETGEMLSCAACHDADPRVERYAHHDPIPCVACHRFQSTDFDELPRIKRQFLPLAPSANPDRFTNPRETEKWFKMNCRLLMQRECTPLEKGDVLTWLLTIR